MTRATSSRLRRFRAPVWQLAGATLVMCGGAYLVAVWMVGVVLMVGGLLFGADALLRDDGPGRQGPNVELFERYKRSA